MASAVVVKASLSDPTLAAEAPPQRSRDYFELFGLPAQFDINIDDLAVRFRKLQMRFHPDKFVSAGAVEQRVAAQISADINTGYRVLSNPVSRARFMLERAGMNLEKVERQPMPGDFLLQQMELREAVAQLKQGNDSERTTLNQQVAELYEQHIEAFQVALQAGDFDGAGSVWQRLLFVDKLRQEIELATAQH